MDESHDAHVEALIKELDGYLTQYKQTYHGLSWRDKVLLLVRAGVTLNELGKNTDSEAAEVCARERLKLYFVKHAGKIISHSELEIVSGISDYARRIRELRTEEGYKIHTGYSKDPELGLDLSPSQYLLLDPEPDHRAARRWKLANRIRKQKTGSKNKLLEYLKLSVGEIITTEELSYVSKDARQYARRVRELRTEEGYPISTRLTGRPDLNIGEYVMESSERIAEPHDRRIPFDVQKQVYERDNNTCLLCGWSQEKWSRDDRRILELHHLEGHAEGGRNALDNLIVICSRCHDEVHSGRREIPTDILV